MKMTWEKFKNYVDKQLKEQSIPQNVELDYIDISSITLIKEATMCDMKNTTEDGKCMDARKDECKWYLDGKCTKKEEDNGTESEVLAKVHEDAQ